MALLRSIRLQEALLSYAILRSQHGMRCIVLSRGLRAAAVLGIYSYLLLSINVFAL